jgi:hypothetical protein
MFAHADIFSQQMPDTLQASIASERLPSLKEYKINYNNRLGEGNFGVVYALLPRPDAEIGFLSAHFPYIYDYIFRASTNHPEIDQPYCIKIFKSSFRIFIENIAHPQPFFLPGESFSQPNKELQMNQILKINGITKISIFNTGYYSQIKSRIHGKTFSYYFENKYFLQENQYLLRKNFIEFLKSIDKPTLTFKDIHGDNLMYDEHTNSWELIDGEAKEKHKNNTISESARNDNNHYTLKKMLIHLKGYLYQEPATAFLFDQFYKIAKNKKTYDQNIDFELLAKAKQLEYKFTI